MKQAGNLDFNFLTRSQKIARRTQIPIDDLSRDVYWKAEMLGEAEATFLMFLNKHKKQIDEMVRKTKIAAIIDDYNPFDFKIENWGRLNDPENNKSELNAFKSINRCTWMLYYFSFTHTTKEQAEVYRKFVKLGDEMESFRYDFEDFKVENILGERYLNECGPDDIAKRDKIRKEILEEWEIRFKEGLKRFRQVWAIWKIGKETHIRAVEKFLK